MASYAVNFWGSKPHTNDDCHTGADYDSFDEAMRVFNNPVEDFFPSNYGSSDIAWVEIDGPNFHHERQNPEYRATRTCGAHPAGRSYVGRGVDDDEWTREIEREHLMLHGSLDA